MAFELPSPASCLFCDAIEGRRENGIVEETESTFTLVNPLQFEEGQLVVVPRRHAPTLLDLADDEAASLMHAFRRAARALIAAFGPDGLTLYQNNGVASGQEVPHFHMHVVPRRASGGRWGQGPPHIAVLERRGAAAARVEISLDRERELAARIRRHLPA